MHSAPLLVEIRAYQLKPGTLARFDALMRERCVPMLHAWPMQVVAFGASPHAPDCYFLARAYADLDARNAQQDAFYGSATWREGPRSDVLALIEQYLDTHLWLSPDAVASMRDANTAPPLAGHVR